MAFPAPIFTKLTTDHQYFTRISYTEFTSVYSKYEN